MFAEIKLKNWPCIFFVKIPEQHPTRKRKKVQFLFCSIKGLPARSAANFTSSLTQHHMWTVPPPQLSVCCILPAPFPLPLCPEGAACTLSPRLCLISSCSATSALLWRQITRSHLYHKKIYLEQCRGQCKRNIYWNLGEDKKIIQMV